jgi:hypothetical protein
LTAATNITAAIATAVWVEGTRTLTAATNITAGISTAVWAETTRLLTAGTNIVLAKGTGVTGFNDLSAAQVNAEVDTALSDYDGPTNAELATALAAADDAVLAAIAALNNLSNAQLVSAIAAGDDATLAAITALNNLSAAQVNAEVVDALATDTYAEPGQGTPAATLSLAAKIGYVFKSWRNKKDETSSLWRLYNDDASTVDQKASVTDDGTTATKGEIATGP